MSDFINSLVVRAYLASKREEGQTFAEYALILALVAVACIGVLGLLAGGIQGTLNAITAKL